MGDGFTHPDPAEVDEDPVKVPIEDPDSTWEAEDVTDDVRLVGEDVSCENCAHADVCQIYATFQENMVGFQQSREQQDQPSRDALLENAPIDPEDLAVICEEYLPVEE